MSTVISVAGLKKSYGSTQAVSGVDLQISQGEIFALLGPNGAGKTTTVEILEGFRDRDSGEVKVLGFDPATKGAAGQAWRDRIGAVVHVDGTARVQTVHREADEAFHTLLGAFHARTGIGILLNTSLNRRGQPIVETPAEAAQLFRDTGLHGLVIGPYLVMKTP